MEDITVFLQTLIEAIVKLLEMSTGLPLMARKVVAYYALATHTLPYTDKFPLLVLRGPMGTGKTQPLAIVKAFSSRAPPLTPRGSTPPAIRDELALCHNGTAIIEEGDGGWRDNTPYEGMLSD